MKAVLVLACLFQEIEVIDFKHSRAYQSALAEYDRAELLLQTDTFEALRSIERVMSNPNISTKDRKIAFERFKGGTGRAYEFYPHQVRALIKLKLAGGEPRNAVELISSAVADLEASVKAGVTKSEGILRTAEAALKATKAPKMTATPSATPKETASEAGFREAWRKLIDGKKFKSAREYVEAKGGFLPREKRETYLSDTDDACRKYVNDGLDAFLRGLEASRPLELRQIKAAEFGRLFALPAEAEIVGTYPALDWSRKERAALERFRLMDPQPRLEDAAPVLEGLVAPVLAAEALQKTGENRWFKASCQLAHRCVEELLRTIVSRAKDATPEDRRRLREVAEKIQSRWTESLARLPKDFLQRNGIHDHRRGFAVLMEGFPVDVEELDRVDLEACFTADSLDSALDRVISDLTKIRDQQGSRLSRDSARKLLTYLVAATATRELLAGRALEDVVKLLGELGRGLAQVGGPLEPGRWGPKIERVFAALH